MRHGRFPTIFIIFAAALLTLLPLSATAWAQEDHAPSNLVHTMQPLSKPYRVIFNCDGYAVFQDAKGDVDQWIANVFVPLDGSHVDALFWCDGSGGNTANYKSDILELSGVRADKVDPYLKKMLDAGQDPPEIMVREAHQRGLDIYYSFRLNDIHDSFIPEEMATFKKEHPEWMIGKGHSYGFWSALKFTVPEVRELKFRTIEEIFQKYDFDGLEIDFMRGVPYFIPGKEIAHAHLLTELLARIRGHLNERSKERGRPIHLAVRVDENLEACRLDGFDVASWIDRGLVDILVMGSGPIDIEVEEFKKLARPKGIPVYPCLYGWPSKYYIIAKPLAAGIALNYWHQGGDGIYLFNWFPHPNATEGKPYQAGFMKHVGDPEVLLENQRKLMFVADRMPPRSANYPHNWMHCSLPASLLTNKEQEALIVVGADLTNTPVAPALTLRLVVENLQEDDLIEVAFNGQSVASLQLADADTLTAPLKPDQVIRGRNRVSMKLTFASPKSDKIRTVTALELDVVFSD
jgi:hypothetical protein